MKRFVTLLTVSITMAAIAFADHPTIDPEYGDGTNFPFHPGAWVSTAFDASDIWQECFCLPTVSYDVLTTDPEVPVRVFNTMRMTGGAGDGCQTTAIQNTEYRNWYQPGSTNSFELDFYFAAQPVSSTDEGVGFYVSDVPQTDLSNPTGIGLGIAMQNTGSFVQMAVLDATGLLTVVPFPVGTPDYRFYLTRVNYNFNENTNEATISVRVFDFVTDPEGVGMTLVDELPVVPVNEGYFGFAANACAINGMVPFQYIDDICLSFGYNPTADAIVAESAFELDQNFPNPFNPTTTISYTAEQTGALSLKVYDLSGSLVSTLVDGMVERGEHEVFFDGSELASGVYFYTLESAGQLDTRKMILVK